MLFRKKKLIGVYRVVWVPKIAFRIAFEKSQCFLHDDMMLVSTSPLV